VLQSQPHGQTQVPSKLVRPMKRTATEHGNCSISELGQTVKNADSVFVSSDAIRHLAPCTDIAIGILF